MARVRNTKLRAGRIQLDYFKRRHPLRHGRLWLGLLLLVGAGAAVAYLGATPDRSAVSPGPVSTGHALIGDRCETCHADPGRAQSRWLGATDGACRACHAVGDHQAAERETPPCGSCHVEHRGLAILARVPSEGCTACHADLAAAAKGSRTLLVGSDARQIRTLADGHPQFAIWVERGLAAKRVRLDATPPPTDGSRLKFSHAKHLSPDLRGPAGTPTVQLVCGDCHQAPLQAATLQFGSKPPPLTPENAPDFAPAEEPQYFAPIRYQTHCAACHPHTFDPRIDAAPHDTPYVVRRFLQGAFARYALEHPDAVAGTSPARPDAGVGMPSRAPSAEEWAKGQVDGAEDLLFRRPCPENEPCPRCQQCHTIEARAGAETPIVAPPAIPVRWLPQSRFDHSAHRLLKCAECHADAAKSTQGADVLLPRVASCRECHHPEGASDRCSECHTYHAASAHEDLDGSKTIRDLVGVGPGS